VSPRLSVVVPTRDRPDALGRCLAALEAQVAPDLDLATDVEVLVVDDGSRDPAAVAATVDARTGPVPVRLVRGEGRGPAAARNLGAARAAGALLCFTDDDCRPEPGWLAALTRRAAAGATVVAGPTVACVEDGPWAAAAQVVTNHLLLESLDPVAGRVGFAPTSNLACSAEVHRRLPFDERFPTAAGEDRDWCARLASEGIALAYEPAARVRHHPGLDLAGFWRQQRRYGRAAPVFRRRAGLRPLDGPGFYARLVRRGFAAGGVVGVLVLLSQAATAAGVAAALLEARRRSPRS
jgi:glycosyltransferase involved in cell wall biosynthesis